MKISNNCWATQHHTLQVGFIVTSQALLLTTGISQKYGSFIRQFVSFHPFKFTDFNHKFTQCSLPAWLFGSPGSQFEYFKRSPVNNEMNKESCPRSVVASQTLFILYIFSNSITLSSSAELWIISRSMPKYLQFSKAVKRFSGFRNTFISLSPTTSLQ